jgi:chemotaxis methyl-accepting protein methylase
MISDDAVEAAVDEVSELLDERIGLRAEPTLRGRLRRSIRDEVSVRDNDLGAYLSTLTHGGDMLQSLVNRVTVQESGFFRHPDHFSVLAERLLPTFEQPVTLWSAGCANGQEAYSLAMVLEEQGVRGNVMASDLSTAALARTAAARYATREITGISAPRRERHLVADGADWTVSPSVRRRVKSSRHNLVTSLPSYVGNCQVVFCRNVLIYFTPERAKEFLERLSQALAPGAYLFLGSAESLWQVTDGFRAERIGESFVYRTTGPSGHVGAAVRTRAGGQVSGGNRGPKDDSTATGGGRGTRTVERPRRAAGPAGGASTGPARRHGSAAGTPDRGAENVFQPVKLASVGQQALLLGDSAAAVVAFRKWVYLTPEDPLASFHLGLALEAGGHERAAHRAFAVALGVLLEGGPTLGAEVALEGYAPEELLRLLETKQGRVA